ncbi:Lrp/AsnC ligand binding domain-containing protein [Desulfobacterota bacterium AH_259_B03_O07]|nr:Lrp/AsnC ligand binding domain-containing protein [Desulfobacterota bacterium AH_259_B03_O07]
MAKVNYFTFFKVQTGKYHDVDERVRDFENVLEIYSLMGEYDLVAVIQKDYEVKVPSTLVEFSEIEGVIQTITAEVIDIVKDSDKPNKVILWPKRKDTAVFSRKLNLYISRNLYTLLILVFSITSLFYYFFNVISFQDVKDNFLIQFAKEHSIITNLPLFLWVPLFMLFILFIDCIRRFIQGEPKINLRAEPGSTNYAFSLINLNYDRYDQVKKELSGFEEVLEGYLVTGICDIIIKWEFSNLESFQRFLTEKLNKILDITKIHTLKLAGRIKEIDQSEVKSDPEFWNPSSNEIKILNKSKNIFLSSKMFYFILFSSAIITTIIGFIANSKNLEKVNLFIGCILFIVLPILYILYFHKVRPFKIRTPVAWTITGLTIALITVLPSVFPPLLSILKFPIQKIESLSNVQKIISNKKALVKVPNANIRNGPGTNYGIITQLKQFDQVEVIDLQNKWYYVNLKESAIKNGWIYRDLVDLIE